ncbi:MAG: phytanoyl-CoA dioxygenase family protein [Myxococcota bacterium]|nr:phytanoyl-CoA dioxygenase family protein [Myxococcota bacterium]
MTDTVPLHPLNEGFAWRPITGPFRRLSEEQAALYNEQGFFVMEDAIPPNVVERVVAEIDPFEDQVEAFLADQQDGRLFINRSNEITFTTHLVNRSAYLNDFVRSALFQDIAADVLGPDVRLYWDQAVYKKPDTSVSFPWHQDNGYTFIDPQQYLTCWIALSDATLDNGCPHVMPGLHKKGTLAHGVTELGFECLSEDVVGVPAEVRAGGIVVFSSLTPHRTGPNSTDGIRKSYIVQYAPDGVEAIFPEPSGGVVRLAAAAEDRQFLVLKGGKSPC